MMEHIFSWDFIIIMMKCFFPGDFSDDVTHFFPGILSGGKGKYPGNPQ